MINQNEQLLTQFKSKDEAFRALFYTYYPRLKLFASKILEDEDAAEDVAISCFGKIREHPFEVTGLDLIEAMLYTIVKNACLDELRKRKTYENHLKRYRELLSGYDERTDYELAYTVTLNKVLQAIEMLPAQRKAIFKMKYIDGLDYESIVHKTNLKYSTVVNHVNDALRDLKAIFHKTKYLYEFLLWWLISSN